jgi:hypothetical protein
MLEFVKAEAFYHLPEPVFNPYQNLSADQGPNATGS